MFTDETIDNAYELRRHIREFVNLFGLASDLRTPCGKPMSVSRAHSLMVLYEAEGGIRISDLSDELHIDLSNVSRLCEKLEREGLIERRPCPDDGRAKRLHLTRDGRALAAEVDGASLSKFASILEKMPDGSLGQVLESLSILNRAIEDDEEDT